MVGGTPASEAGAAELTLTLYPEALTCSPLLVRVDFMRMKKERSWTREKGGTSVALASRVGSEGRLGGLRKRHGPLLPPIHLARQGHAHSLMGT